MTWLNKEQHHAFQLTTQVIVALNLQHGPLKNMMFRIFVPPYQKRLAKLEQIDGERWYMTVGLFGRRDHGGKEVKNPNGNHIHFRPGTNVNTKVMQK